MQKSGTRLFRASHRKGIIPGVFHAATDQSNNCLIWRINKTPMRLPAFLYGLLCLLTVFSCHPKSATTMPGNKTPYVNEHPFTKGPAFNHPDEVYQWAESMQNHPNGKQRHFRLPVFVDRTPEPDVLNPRRYYAGVEKGSSDQQALEIRLDDGRLGVSLSDRIDQYCPEPEQSCIIQVEATWGPLMQYPSAMRDDRPVFALVTVSAFTEDVSPGNGAFFIYAEE
jgi:hypothetical protein